MTASSTVTLVGNLTRDPELRYLTSGVGLANFGIAVNRRYQKNNEWVDDTSFFDVTCWRELADNVSESLSKGDRVVVTGRLEQRTWETDSGDKRSKVEITADDVAPSLRWAMVTEIQRNPKKGNAVDGPPRGQSADDRSGGGGYNYEDAEEPF